MDNGLSRYMLCRWELHAGQQEHHKAVLARSKVGCCGPLRESDVTGVVSSSQLQSSSIPPSMEALYGACRHVKRK